MTDNITVVSNGLPNETHSNSTENAWDKKPKIVKPENIELQEKVMAKETVSHSGYVPAQLERHLEFMNFNTGENSDLVHIKFQIFTFTINHRIFTKKVESEFLNCC